MSGWLGPLARQSPRLLPCPAVPLCRRLQIVVVHKASLQPRLLRTGLRASRDTCLSQSGVAVGLGKSRQRMSEFSVQASKKGEADPKLASPNHTPLPNPVHRVIHAGEVGDRRVIIVGDIHGCYDEFRQLLEAAEHRPEDLLILVGDLVNKGPKSPEVVDAARALGAYAVRGNHDDAALASKKDWDAYCSGKGEKPEKREWVKDLSVEAVEWLQALPYTLALPSHNVLVVHAGLVPGVPLPQQSLKHMYSMRFVKEAKPSKAGSGKRKVHSEEDGVARQSWEVVETEEDGAVLWGSVWQGPEHVVFGHDAVRALQLHKKATGLDTGCVYGGRMTALVLPPASAAKHLSNEGDSQELPAGWRLVSVKSRDVYAPAKSIWKQIRKASKRTFKSAKKLFNRP